MCPIQILNNHVIQIDSTTKFVGIGRCLRIVINRHGWSRCICDVFPNPPRSGCRLRGSKTGKRLSSSETQLINQSMQVHFLEQPHKTKKFLPRPPRVDIGHSFLVFAALHRFLRLFPCESLHCPHRVHVATIS